MRTLILLSAVVPTLAHAATYFEMKIARDTQAASREKGVTETCTLGGGSPAQLKRKDSLNEDGVIGTLRFENKDAGINGAIRFPQWGQKDSGWELKEKHVREITFESKESGATKVYALRVEKGGIYKVTVSGQVSPFVFDPKDSTGPAGPEGKELKSLFGALIESLMPVLLVYESGYDADFAKVCGATVDRAVVSSRLRSLTDWIQAHTVVKKTEAPHFNGGTSPAVN